MGWHRSAAERRDDFTPHRMPSSCGLDAGGDLTKGRAWLISGLAM